MAGRPFYSLSTRVICRIRSSPGGDVGPRASLGSQLGPDTHTPNRTHRHPFTVRPIGETEAGFRCPPLDVPLCAATSQRSPDRGLVSERRQGHAWHDVKPSNILTPLRETTFHLGSPFVGFAVSGTTTRRPTGLQSTGRTDHTASCKSFTGQGFASAIVLWRKSNSILRLEAVCWRATVSRRVSFRHQHALSACSALLPRCGDLWCQE